jgi:hypothetical protein
MLSPSVTLGTPEIVSATTGSDESKKQRIRATRSKNTSAFDLRDRRSAPPSFCHAAGHRSSRKGQGAGMTLLSIPTTTIPVRCQTAAIMIPILNANSFAQDWAKNSPSRNMQDPLQS